MCGMWTFTLNSVLTLEEDGDLNTLGPTVHTSTKQGKIRPYPIQKTMRVG